MGLGYIGLPTAAVIARSGCPVLGIDIHEQVVETINSGKIHIEEVDLDGLVQGVVARDATRFADGRTLGRIYYRSSDPVRRQSYPRYQLCDGRSDQYRRCPEGRRHDHS